jgi:hypothetical protein
MNDDGRINLRAVKEAIQANAAQISGIVEIGSRPLVYGPNGWERKTWNSSVLLTSHNKKILVIRFSGVEDLKGWIAVREHWFGLNNVGAEM